MAQVKLPKILKDFCIYLTTIRGKSQRTRKEYEYDLVLAFRFLKAIQEDIPVSDIHMIDISDITIEWIKELTLEDLYLFLEYCEVQRKNSAVARARKVATLRSFFKYLKGKRRLIEENIAEELETPKIGKRKPVYLDLEEARLFIGAIHERPYSKRDYCMMMFFLNLGIRVSELCALNLSSIQGRKVTIIGKGNKERTVYLNDACLAALEQYIPERTAYKGEGDEPLFVSQKGTRFTRQTVARIVKQINHAGLQKELLTPHKLRHTSATIMYKAGADIRSLQHILGHSSVATTQIYTHIEDEQIQQVMEKSPFNNIIM
ncbi:tyrosine recombinase XerC [Lysinibacillus odysseyi]|uniref:Recombinase XerC n=1 Tax=Lysinibacillus odysseyi 34hs-1 = NBRC 100172 TaxID=1220589 RepID=A0A0A3IGE3_9BACI|nr:tyrosine recombinase XerC [Lysinibacillus odysseyi]KGR81888.1 recombinase XerC [Lysinibacillus odysseyi 34hs-1 = NBRC 100172]